MIDHLSPAPALLLNNFHSWTGCSNFVKGIRLIWFQCSTAARGLCLDTRHASTKQLRRGRSKPTLFSFNWNRWFMVLINLDLEGLIVLKWLNVCLRDGLERTIQASTKDHTKNIIIVWLVKSVSKENKKLAIIYITDICCLYDRW